MLAGLAGECLPWLWIVAWEARDLKDSVSEGKG